MRSNLQQSCDIGVPPPAHRSAPERSVVANEGRSASPSDDSILQNTY